MLALMILGCVICLGGRRYAVTKWFCAMFKNSQNVLSS